MGLDREAAFAWKVRQPVFPDRHFPDMANKNLSKQLDSGNSVANIRMAVAMAGLRSALTRLRSCCVCLIVDPRHAGARRELGHVLLADLHDAFEAGTLARSYAEEVRSHGEDLALRLERAGVSTARAWLAMQANFDLAEAMQRDQPAIQPLDDKAA